jgi:O-antigen ligase
VPAIATYPMELLQLSFSRKAAILLGIVGISVGVFFLQYPPYVIPALAAVLLVSFFTRPFYLLSLYVCSLILVNLKTRGAPNELGPIELFTGAVLTLGIAYVLFLALTRKKNIYIHPAEYWVAFYCCWALIGGVISIINNSTTLNATFRDFLAFSPLVIMPVLYREASKDTPNFERRFFKILLLIWVAVFVYAVTHIRSSMVTSTYLFETNFKGVDILNGSFMLFLFLSLLAIERSKRRRNAYALASAFAFIGVGLSFHRTGWVACLACIPILLILSKSTERKVLTRYGTRLIILLIIAFGICILILPLAKAILLFFLSRLLTSSHVSTDASLLGRYVEWRYVIAEIVSNPVLGVGFGGQYYMYGWLVGFSTPTGYTHNGFLMLLLKGGIVGFIAMMIAQIQFLILGFKLTRSPLLTESDKVLTKVAVIVIIILFIEMQTMGIFAHREVLWYLGLVWGALTAKYEKVLSLRSDTSSLSTSSER